PFKRRAHTQSHPQVSRQSHPPRTHLVLRRHAHAATDDANSHSPWRNYLGGPLPRIAAKLPADCRFERAPTPGNQSVPTNARENKKEPPCPHPHHGRLITDGAMC